MQTRVDTIRTEIDRTEMNVNVRYRCSTISEKGLMVSSSNRQKTSNDFPRILSGYGKPLKVTITRTGTRSGRIDRKRISDINKFLNYTREIDVRWLFGEHCRVWLDGKQNKTKSAHKNSRRHYIVPTRRLRRRMNGIVPEFQHVKNPSLPTTADPHPHHPLFATVSSAAVFYYFFLFRSAGGRLQRDPGARHKLHDWSNGGHPPRLCRRGRRAGSIFRRTAGTSLVCPPPPPSPPPLHHYHRPHITASLPPPPQPLPSTTTHEPHLNHVRHDRDLAL
ncbi:Uncharacterized protein FWK35_00008398 [Aphis craccivora]|uniref:Uncharacterized protein n=1 Tax=Aphis craccivora TaxID=307492 RepID=A0A6G0Z7I5_APHCR|nr:Uncharacterized protein FWK35_00008398 [Aphis craccivora]